MQPCPLVGKLGAFAPGRNTSDLAGAVLLLESGAVGCIHVGVVALLGDKAEKRLDNDADILGCDCGNVLPVHRKPDCESNVDKGRLFVAAGLPKIDRKAAQPAQLPSLPRDGTRIRVEEWIDLTVHVGESLRIGPPPRSLQLLNVIPPLLEHCFRGAGEALDHVLERYSDRFPLFLCMKASGDGECLEVVGRYGDPFSFFVILEATGKDAVIREGVDDVWIRHPAGPGGGPLCQRSSGGGRAAGAGAQRGRARSGGGRAAGAGAQHSRARASGGRAAPGAQLPSGEGVSAPKKEMPSSLAAEMQSEEMQHKVALEMHKWLDNYKGEYGGVLVTVDGKMDVVPITLYSSDDEVSKFVGEGNVRVLDVLDGKHGALVREKDCFADEGQRNVVAEMLVMDNGYKIYGNAVFVDSVDDDPGDTETDKTMGLSGGDVAGEKPLPL